MRIEHGWMLSRCDGCDRASVFPCTRRKLPSCGDGSLPCYSDDDIEIVQPRITRVSPIVYWDSNRPAVANSSSAMSFWGNCFRIELHITISGPTAVTRELEPTADCPSFLLTNHDVSTRGMELVVNGSCGHVANLSGRHHAYSRLFLEYRGLTQLEASASASRGAPQPDCCPAGAPKGGETSYSVSSDLLPVSSQAATCTGDTGGGGGSSGPTMRCYTLTVDHYWYYPDTDTYEYRYSESTSWCEESST